MGLFGTPADIIIDINLIIQYIVLLLLVVGYLRRRPLKNHGKIMASATLLNLATVFVIMAPALILNFASYPITILTHAMIGIAALLFGLLFTIRFLMTTRKGEPLACGSKNVMRLAILIWLASIIGGTFFYLEHYILSVVTTG
jgi:uncharacterized membrane protein YozB (DUF420 family)